MLEVVRQGTVAGWRADQKGCTVRHGDFRTLQKRVLQGWSSAQQKGKVLEAALAARDALFYSIMWSTGLRASDTLRRLTQGIERFVVPDGKRREGWYLHIGGSKTETRAKQACRFQL
jgi:hypothetical protein